MQSSARKISESVPAIACQPKAPAPYSKGELQKIGLIFFIKDGEKCSVGFASICKDTSEPPAMSFLDWENYKEMYPLQVCDHLNFSRHLRNNSKIVCTGINAVHKYIMEKSGETLTGQAQTGAAEDELAGHSKTFFNMEELEALKVHTESQIAKLSTSMGKYFEEFQKRCSARPAHLSSANASSEKKMRKRCAQVLPTSPTTDAGSNNGEFVSPRCSWLDSPPMTADSSDASGEFFYFS